MKTIYLKKTIGILLCGIINVSCGQISNTENNNKIIEGNGEPSTEERVVKNFSTISFSGAYNITIKCGSDKSVKITADSNILPIVKTETKSNNLHVTIKQSITTNNDIKVEIEIPDISSINLMGESIATVSKINNERFDISISGSGELTTRGSTKNTTLIIDGSGTIHNRYLNAEKAILKILGAGDAEVYAKDKLDITIEGMGNITYYGSPETINRNIMGMGSIQPGE